MFKMEVLKLCLDNRPSGTCLLSQLFGRLREGHWLVTEKVHSIILSKNKAAAITTSSLAGHSDAHL